ncbi:hypothetical protein LTR91_014444 [Friedmanniomyces endolithicus]|uniref:Uncharacterized protein n=1 Tax=Friedmanniomyces endolithicus TaxID=329885 RepID=A0AAN6J929_9PEZI|nr:hypothetical protein LTR35_008409 [Friedmanniomyces endolithicus]KAK0294840.1 hypothetical protein LTS00_006675 [Friedmanniomyces endolithicus]KAK0320976.1 hypothetical protein LTR82_007893 [Friedmanniomyces endolithicus]KAK0926413.1 hypothetical protein LTR57_004270 [Friedmanniomyces endolithicus]KAK0969901.1 hypothetical protein LTS01_016027 [Friedmanniomyces endolithicus]
MAREAPRGIREWFQPKDGIDREVISANIQRYLGPDATVRPGRGTGNNEGVDGYWIKAYRTLTNPMVLDLQQDSRRWNQELRTPGARGRHLHHAVGMPGITAPDPFAGPYDQSATHHASATNAGRDRRHGDSPVTDGPYEAPPPRERERGDRERTERDRGQRERTTTARLPPGRVDLEDRDRMDLDPPLVAQPDRRFAQPERERQYQTDGRVYVQEGRGYPPDGRAYPQEGRAYPPEGRAYPPEGRPYPPDNRAYPLDNRAYPPDNRAYPPDNRAYPPDNRAYPPDNRAYPPENRAYRTEARQPYQTEQPMAPAYGRAPVGQPFPPDSRYPPGYLPNDPPPPGVVQRVYLPGSSYETAPGMPIGRSEQPQYQTGPYGQPNGAGRAARDPRFGGHPEYAEPRFDAYPSPATTTASMNGREREPITSPAQARFACSVTPDRSRSLS